MFNFAFLPREAVHALHIATVLLSYVMCPSLRLSVRPSVNLQRCYSLR